MHRLAQIMTGSGQKPGFGMVGAFRRRLLPGQIVGSGIDAPLHVFLKGSQGLAHLVDALLQFA